MILDNLFEMLMEVLTVTLIVGGISIVPVVLLVVQFAKKFKTKGGDQALQGNALLWFGLLVGFILGAMAYLVNFIPPIGAHWYDWTVWSIVGFVYCVLLGIMPSGLFDLIKKAREGWGDEETLQ